MRSVSTPTTIMQALLPTRGVLRDLPIDAVLVVGYALLTGLAAQIKFFVNPAVPITGQTFAVLLAGATLGSKRGFASMSVYLAAGIIGLPVFASGGAISGASRGYLIGFVAAAVVVGYLAERGWSSNPYKLITAMFAGEVLIYAFGLPWLAFYVPRDKVLEYGLTPFIFGDTFKLLLAALLVPICLEGIRRLKNT